MKILCAVQEKIHSCDGRGGQVLLLPIEVPEHHVLIATMLFHIVQRLKEHSGTAGWIVDGFACLGRQNAHHQRHNRSRGTELPCFLVGQIRKFLDQVFIGLAQDIRLAPLIPQAQGQEVLDQILEQSV